MEYKTLKRIRKIHFFKKIKTELPWEKGSREICCLVLLFFLAALLTEKNLSGSLHLAQPYPQSIPVMQIKNKWKFDQLLLNFGPARVNFYEWIISTNTKNINHYICNIWIMKILIIIIAFMKVCIILLPIYKYSKHHSTVSNHIYSLTFFER